jgi:hypothetical protein
MAEPQTKPAHEVILDVLAEVLDALGALSPTEKGNWDHLYVGKVQVLVEVMRRMTIPEQRRDEFMLRLRQLGIGCLTPEASLAIGELLGFLEARATILPDDNDL